MKALRNNLRSSTRHDGTGWVGDGAIGGDGGGIVSPGGDGFAALGDGGWASLSGGDGEASPGGDGGGYVSSPGDGWRKVGHAAAVVDLDNLLHRGFDKTKKARPQAMLDVIGLASELRKIGVIGGTVCRHHGFSAFAEMMWRSLGFKVVAANDNCDPEVIAEAFAYAKRSDITKIVLVAGDGDYCKTVNTLKRAGLEVEVWGRRANTSQDLARCAGRVLWVDQFLSEKPQSATRH